MAAASARTILLLALAFPVAFAVETFRVALISELTGSSSPGQKTFVTGFRDFVAPYINSVGGMPSNGDFWNISVVSYDTQSNATFTMANISAAIAAGVDMKGNSVGDFHAIIAATSSSNGIIKPVGEMLQIPNVHTSGGNPTTWSDAQPFAFGMHLPFPQYTRGPLRMAAIRGLKTVGIIRSVAHGFPKASCIAALAFAMESGLRVVGPTVAWCNANMNKTGQCRVVTSGGTERCVCGVQADVNLLGYKYQIEQVPTFYELDELKIGAGLNVGRVDNETTDFVRTMLQDMRAQLGGEVPDVLLNFAYESHNVLNAIYKEDFAPKMVAGWQGNTEVSWAKDLTGTLTEIHGFWAVGFGQWHPAMKFSCPLFGSNANAVKLFKEQIGRDLDYDTAGGVAAGTLLYQVMKSYLLPTFKTADLATKRDLLRRGIGQMNDETMWGLIRFNRNNQNFGRDTSSWQILPGAVPGAAGFKKLCVLPNEVAETELILPFPTKDSRFGCAAGFFNNLARCIPCPAGQISPTAGLGLKVTTCDVCPLNFGTAPHESGMTQCSPCPAGTSHEVGTGICRPCGAGLYRATGSMATVDDTKCQFCPFGQYSVSSGALACAPCATGSFMDNRGATACKSCSAGSVAATPGRSLCDACTVGMFAESSAMIACEACPAGMKTLQAVNLAGSQQLVYLQGSSSRQTCGCDAGSFADADGTCKSCPDGMLCHVGSDIKNLALATLADGPMGNSLKPYPVAKPGMWTSKTAPLSVFACRSDLQCPGGAPESCSANLYEQSCDRPVEGYRWNGKQCIKCSNVETSSFLFPVLPLLMVPALIAGMYKMFGDGIDKWESWQNIVAVLVFVALNHYQIANIVVTCNVKLPQGYNNVLEAFAWSNDMIGVLKPECAGLMSFQQDTVAKALFPIFMLLVTVCLKGLSFVVSLLVRRPELNMDVNRLFNVFMSLMFTFFNAIVCFALILFKCSSNPNGASTLSADFTVVCWSSSEWKSMLVIGIVCVLLYIIGVGSLFTRTVYIAPKGLNFGDPGFQMRWKFLFIKFRASIPWWSLAFLAKNFLLNLGLVIFISGVEQMYWIMSVVIGYLCLTMLFMPFRARIANYLELASGVSVIYLTSIVTWFADRTDGKFDIPLSKASSALIFLPLVVAFCMILYVVYMGRNPQGLRKTIKKQHALVADVLPKYGRLASECWEKSEEFFASLADWDRYYMTKAAEVVAHELVGQRSGMKLVNSSSKNLQILQSLGEATAAKDQAVLVVI